MRQNIFIASLLGAVVTAGQDFDYYSMSNTMPIDMDDEHWQQWPDFCYTTNGRKQVINVTCGSKYSQTEQCDWSPGGGKRVWMWPG